MCTISITNALRIWALSPVIAKREIFFFYLRPVTYSQTRIGFINWALPVLQWNDINAWLTASREKMHFAAVIDALFTDTYDLRIDVFFFVDSWSTRVNNIGSIVSGAVDQGSN